MGSTLSLTRGLRGLFGGLRGPRGLGGIGLSGRTTGLGGGGGTYVPPGNDGDPPVDPPPDPPPDDPPPDDDPPPLVLLAAPVIDWTRLSTTEHSIAYKFDPLTPMIKNLCTHNRDITAGNSWSQGTPGDQTFPALRNAVGVDGVANSAMTLNAIQGTPLFYKTITVEENAQYTMFFSAKKGTATEPRTAIYNATAGAFIQQGNIYTPGDGTFKRVSRRFTTPAGCTSVRIYPLRGVTSFGTVIVDDICLVKGIVDPGFCPTDASLNSAAKVVNEYSTNDFASIAATNTTLLDAAEAAGGEWITGPDLNQGTTYSLRAYTVNANGERTSEYSNVETVTASLPALADTWVTAPNGGIQDITASASRYDFGALTLANVADERQAVYAVFATNGGTALRHTSIIAYPTALEQTNQDTTNAYALPVVNETGQSGAVASTNYVSQCLGKIPFSPAYITLIGSGGPAARAAMRVFEHGRGLSVADVMTVAGSSLGAGVNPTGTMDVPADGIALIHSQTTTNTGQSATATGYTEVYDGAMTGTGTLYNTGGLHDNAGGGAIVDRTFTTDWAVDPGNYRHVGIALGPKL